MLPSEINVIYHLSSPETSNINNKLKDIHKHVLCYYFMYGIWIIDMLWTWETKQGAHAH